MRTARIALALASLSLAALAAADDEFAPVRDMIRICTSCHSERATSQTPQYPILSGQEYYYLYVQLKDFKSGLRQSAIMGPIVQTLQPEELKLFAKFFSLETWPAIGHATDHATVEAAKRAIASGECFACHLGDFRGNSRVPRLAGQHPEYLLQTMLDFKNRVRDNMPAMSALLATFGEHDIVSLADYLASLTVYESSQTGEIQ
jgi:cytochrome c553